MHDLIVQECQHCRNFRYAFSENGPLWDWGYCALERKDKPVISPEEATAVENEARQDDRRRLLDGRFGLYKLEADDGCDLFTPWDHEHEERAEDEPPRVGRGGI